jgi:alpha-L-arabinofuranosidase
VNSAWGGVIDTNAFGTDEFMDFIQQIGSTAVCLRQCRLRNSARGRGVAGIHDRRSAHGACQGASRQRPSRSLYKVGFLGIGNESWDCGGDMTPDYYVSQMKVYSRFVST